MLEGTHDREKGQAFATGDSGVAHVMCDTSGLCLFVNRGHLSQGSTAENGLEAQCKMVTLIKLQVGKVAGLVFFFPFGLSHLLFNYWAPCVVNHINGLFSDLVIQSLNHIDPLFYPFPEVFINLLCCAWDSKSYKIAWTSKTEKFQFLMIFSAKLRLILNSIFFYCITIVLRKNRKEDQTCVTVSWFKVELNFKICYVCEDTRTCMTQGSGIAAPVSI